VTAAAKTVAASWPSDSRQGPIINANAAGAYPIATFTYLLYYQTQTDLPKAQAFVSFYYWSQTDGVQYEEQLGYAPIPDSVKAIAFEALHTITVSGTPVWPK
jgi:phosphate transport system substrate-binding protein